MVQDQENRYNIYMVYNNVLKKIAILLVMPIILGSCASINNFINDDDESSSEVKDVNLNKRLAISIPMPENSKYLVEKTIIFGEGSRFSGVLYLMHDQSADEVVEFYRVKMRDDGWSEIAIVRSDFVLLNFDKEDRFATIKVIRKVFDNSSSEVTIGPKSDTTINRSINIDTIDSVSDEPFSIQ